MKRARECGALSDADVVDVDGCDCIDDDEAFARQLQAELDAEEEVERQRKRERVASPLPATPTPQAFHLSHIRGLPDSSNVGAVSLCDLLSLDAHLDAKKMVQFNYLLNPEWFKSELERAGRKGTPTLFVVHDAHTYNGFSRAVAREWPTTFHAPPTLPMFGTHHTKMMLLFFSQGMRVVVHTANLRPTDWGLKTQGAWISPFLPLVAPADNTPVNSHQFCRSLIKYLNAYNLEPLRLCAERVARHDFSAIKHARLVCSVPGSHQSENEWGHRRLRWLLRRATPSPNIVGQFSSIGTLGPKAKWLTDEFLLSLCGGDFAATRNARLRLIFPTVDNIRESLEGYAGGRSVPYQQKTHVKQSSEMRQLRLFHSWQCGQSGRTRTVPHIKTYAGYSSADALNFAYVGSHNLSKAAWGSVNKGDGALFIRSFEVGVVFVSGPKLKLVYAPTGRMDKETERRNGKEKEAECDVLVVPLPYDLPPVEYTRDDAPWVCDVPYREPDALGETQL